MKPKEIHRLPSIRQALRWLGPAYPGRRLGLAAVVVCLIVGLLGQPATGALVVIALGLLAAGAIWLFNALHFVDVHIGATVGRARGWPVHSKAYPLYKFVDIHRAAERFATQQPGSVELRSEHPFVLGGILHGISRPAGRRLNSATMVSRKVGYDQETYLPTDTFWLLPPQVGTPDRAAVIRVRLTPHTGMVALEVAAPRAEAATRILDALAELASEHSIYRNHMIRVVFGPEVHSDYGDDESLEPMDLVFYNETPIAADDIILDETHHGIIERTIVDFHQRREQLLQLGLPGKRGVLFYGPPGTGKTYTCKYIAQRLTSVTTIVVTGHALLHMKAICAIAKMLQPALVLLEDVDLVFAHRENNAYNTVLGEFIDQLDGFGESDQIIFILTTNAIDRIEPAIKDRPGRVSQCIYFGPPSAVLRRRYLDKLVQPYDSTALNLARVVGQTESVSQAFLKELVFRAVQIASASPSANGAGLRLNDDHFASALHDMTNGSGQAAHKIIGFRMEIDR
ncbi:MAG TPA: ATP-binding protein [Roseiflexaceae bacterium]|nr:ATP-binding protein [Roseiflexaceae bacterium]